MKPLFVILVTYRRLEYLKQTIDSLMPSLPSGSKIVIYDNNSPEPEVHEYLRSIASEHCEIILADKNQGWGVAMNETLRLHPEWKEYEYVLESNNDVIYKPDWFEKSKALMQKYSKIGIFALWKHIHHGVRHELDDLLIMDNAPAVAWLMRPAHMEKLMPWVENGPAQNRGGNGEDTGMVLKCQELLDLWVASPKEDLAEHIDGYDDKLGQNNEAYS